MNHAIEVVGDFQINERAPIILAGEVEVAAELDVVWDVLARIESWPTWNPEVKTASLEGDLTPGTVFRWRAGRSLLSRDSSASKHRARSRGPARRWASESSTSTA